jgi:hypothetical protein
VVLPATAPDGPVRATAAAVTGSLKVAVTGPEVATPDAPDAGAREDRTGAVVSTAVVLKTTSTQ